MTLYFPFYYKTIFLSVLSNHEKIIELLLKREDIDFDVENDKGENFPFYATIGSAIVLASKAFSNPKYRNKLMQLMRKL